jgi:ubiquinol-cytochrome c reductase iron-sulfur subunit
VKRSERVVAVCFALSILAGVAVLVVYARGGQTQLEGALLGVALGGIGAGLIVWGRDVIPHREITEARHLRSSELQRERMEATLREGEEKIGRRSALVRLLLAAGGALGLAALFPIRSLGPSPGDTLLRTPWHAGLRLVTEEGDPVNANDLTLDSFVSVFPEGFVGSPDGQAVLVRVEPSSLRLPSGLVAGAPDGFVAYSKVCTHAGCPVGLYLAATHQLRCPCHQSTFDVLNGAEPVYGPAPRPLPQLPLMIDADGTIRATGDFDAPVGASFWSLP